MDIAQVDARVIRVVDVKTPASGEQQKNRLENFDHLTSRDQLKFVICNRDDYQWSKQMLADYDLNQRCEVLFSPSETQLPADQLADWILQDHLPVRMQMQLHKVLWGGGEGR
jgi:7-carboxy-7-deazaguanine synthase